MLYIISALRIEEMKLESLFIIHVIDYAMIRLQKIENYDLSVACRDVTFIPGYVNTDRVV